MSGKGEDLVAFLALDLQVRAGPFVPAQDVGTLRRKAEVLSEYFGRATLLFLAEPIHA